MAILAGTALALFIIGLLSTNTFHNAHWVSPVTIGLGGGIGIALGALALFALRRYLPGGTAQAAA
jgi:hypothetical protein